MSKMMYDFRGLKMEKTLIFYTYIHTYIHTSKYCRAEKIADGDFNRNSREVVSND